MAEASEVPGETPDRTQETVIADNPAGYIYDRILEIYPFLTDDERRDYVTKASCLTSLDPLEILKYYLELLNNPHAKVKELQPKDDKEYQSPIKRPNNLTKELPYSETVGGVLYIDIPSRHLRYVEVPEILDQLIEGKGKKVKGFILDLRKNHGGGDRYARRFAQHFLPSGDIIFGRQVTICNNKPTEKPLVYSSNNKNPITSPIALLVSDSTFSACERFIALIKQRNNVVIIGSETCGGSAGAKDFYIEIDGKKYTVPIPTWRFFLPGEDRPLEETKIQPDIYQDPTKPEIVDYAIKYVRAMAQIGKNIEP